MAAAVLTMMALTQAAFAAGHARRAHVAALTIQPSASGSNVDCNGWSDRYAPARPQMRSLCTDPIAINRQGKASRLIDNGWYVGHDEPSVKFISSQAHSGNTMTYYMQLPVDPSAPPTSTGSVTNYGELSVAPWFGLPICDPHSYPQNPCTPDSDTNSGAINDPNAAGSAFMELQFYPPGFTPFVDSESCSPTQWCSALNIDSLECTYGFATCNNNCIEPVNFAFLQLNGMPSGPPDPQDPSVRTFVPNGLTLRMNPGDVLKVSITDPPGGLTTTVRDLTTGQVGYMQASAANGFANTSIADCSGTPFSFHAEYNTAQQQNQVPWAALEGGVLMEQEIGHYESCNRLAVRDGVSQNYTDGTSYVDQRVFQTCLGGVEGAHHVGEGPCNPSGTFCFNASTQGAAGPTRCATHDATTGALCEFADGYCFPAGTRIARINGTPTIESARVTGCFETQFQNGDLDFDGNPYLPNQWPGSGSNVPTAMRYAGPYTVGGAPYPNIQVETDVGGSENLCNTTTGAGCTAPPIGAAFYPYWSLNDSQTLAGSGQAAGACVWNFGSDIPGVTVNDLGGDAQYGTPNTTRYGGTIISGVQGNPALQSGCGAGAS
ncbi:MAG TPA: hypothetical protein VFN87_08610 [Solirubrobacteraceae bacterium]|nr:hypothetical protein [Solirubrobacteraceae bacterium]